MTAADELLVMDGLMDAASFGLRLRELRVAAGLSQLALAKAAGVSQNAISQWEAGQRQAMVTMIPKLAAALGVPVEAMFDEAGSTPPTPKRGRPKKHDDE